jgi:drug/metabolite transporter (DMT)-like permease
LFIFHFLGFEPFELPSVAAGKLLFISVLANIVFSGSFLILISLTSPVLSSVAALLTIFLVAITDWWLFGTPVSAAGILGGLLIVAAFGGLAWDSWKEVEETNEEESDSGSDA